VGTADNTRRITNLANPENATDGANKGYVDQQVANSDAKFNSKLNKVAASNAALIPTMMSRVPGALAVDVGMGYRKQQGAIGVNFNYLGYSGNASVGGGIAYDGDAPTARIGVGYLFR
jgi:hypothetical protein